MTGFGDLATTIENAFTDNLPRIKELITETVGPAARGAVENEQTCRFVATKIYNALPLPMRKTLSEMEFADLFCKNRHAVFSTERVEEIRIAPGETLLLGQASESEIIKGIYEKIAAQKNALDEIANDLRLLEKGIDKKS